MTAHVLSATVTGGSAVPIEVECDTSNNLPAIVIVGLGNRAIDEAKERVRSAITNSGLLMPPQRLTVNLAPADLRKDGAAFDLPIAAAILLASGQLEPQMLRGTMLIGELSLDGTLRPVRGILGIIEAARSLEREQVLIPAGNAEQAALAEGVDIIPCGSLMEAVLHLRREAPLRPLAPRDVTADPPAPQIDMSEVHGQPAAKRALEIAAAGHHNLLMTGPPGTGKTMLARALAGILPPLSRAEIAEVTQLHSLAGSRGLQLARPFRSPHHTASTAALVGGGRLPSPGEISLAHRGVLFLDELPEYARNALEALRQPLEDKMITIARAEDTLAYPADFMLIATLNPCPCGYHGDDRQQCTCSLSQIAAYQKRLSGPLLDRFDMTVRVDRIASHSVLATNGGEETSRTIAARIAAARTVQADRNAGQSNARLDNRDLKRWSGLSTDARSLLSRAADTLNLSTRAFMRTIKVARTIADLSGEQHILEAHIAEALQYRQRPGEL